MKICVYGVGAVGAYLAVKLAGIGAEVSCVARGAHLEAIQKHGLKLIIDGREEMVRIRAVEDLRELGPQDYVIMALKAPAALAVAAHMAPLLGPKTAVVTAQNGLPWWYFYKSGGAYEGRRLAVADPEGKQWDLIGPERAIGCVVYSAGAIVAPGVVAHSGGDKFILGEPDGLETPRIMELANLLIAAGLRAPVRPDIRNEIWLKLWGNATFNPISALTRANLEQIVNDPEVCGIVRRGMEEIEAVAAALGVTFPLSIDKRIEITGRLGGHKTSMLQDIESGRQMEVDALVGTVQELARLTGVLTPTLDIIASLVKLEAAVTGCG